MDLNIQKDGMTYVIEMEKSIGTGKVHALLREDEDGWFLVDCLGNQDWVHRIGRRKDWKKALSDALAYMEWKLGEYE